MANPALLRPLAARLPRWTPMHLLVESPVGLPGWTPVYRLAADDYQELAASARARVSDRSPSTTTRPRVHATIVPMEDIRRQTLFGTFREMLLDDED